MISKKIFFILIILTIFINCTEIDTIDRQNTYFKNNEKKEAERLNNKCLKKLSEGKSSYECKNIDYQNDF